MMWRLAATVAVLGTLSWTGCSADRYHAQADSEVYGILDARRAQLLGDTNRFRIDTPVTARAPEDVNGTDVVLDRYQGGQRVLPLAEAMRTAVRHNRTYQFNREKLYLQALSLTGTRHQFALKFTKATVDAGADRSSTTGKTTLDGDADATLKKALLAGGQLGATLANDLVFFFDGTKPKVPSITLSLTQPLLRGAGADIAAEVLTQAERDVVYEIRSFSHYQKQFAVDIIRDYYSLLRQAENVRQYYTNYQSRIVFRREMETRVRAGLSAEFEREQSLESEYRAKLDYIRGVETYQNQLDDYKQQLSLPLGERVGLDRSLLSRIETAGLPPVPFDDQTAYRMAITNRLDVINQIDKFEDSKRKVFVARNDLKPGLSIVADMELKDQFYSSFSPDQYRANAGLKLDLPLDQLTERNALRQSEINFERQMRTLATTLDQLRDEVRQGLRNLDRQGQNYATQLAALENARRNLLATQLRLRAGFQGVRTSDIITAQDALLRAQLAVTTAVVDYHTTRLNLLKDVGILQTTGDDFWLRDPLLPLAPLIAAPPVQQQEVVPPDQVLGP